MKILNIFNHYLHPGGEAFAVETICNALSRFAEVETCEFWSHEWVGPDAPAKWKQAALMVRNPRSLNTLRQHHRRFKPDVWLIHNVFPVGSAAIYPEAQRLRVPIIQYLHNFRPFSVNGYLWAGGKLASGGLAGNFLEEIRHAAWQESRLKTAWFAMVLKLMHTFGWWSKVRAWIAISDFVRNKVIEAGLPEVDVFTLPYPWRQPVITSVRVFRENHYLFLGRLVEAKGVKVLLETWQILEQRFGSGTPRLLIAGSGPLEKWVATKAADLQTVTFAGQLDGEKKQNALANARAVIVPSLWWEALGIVAYDAYDNAKPVLAAKSGGLSETVVHERTGLLHVPGDARQLADQIAYMEANPELRRKMGDEGRRRLHTICNQERWQEKFSAILAYATR